MSVTALHVLAVALGGALGGVARVWLAGVVTRRLGEGFPWGTLVVNVSGSGLIGVAAALALGQAGSAMASPSAWALLVIGVLGSYTTVSSFSFQTLVLLDAGETGRAGANVAASVILCLGTAAAAWFGTGWMVSA
ncbi:MAG TPA: fluoride efflux transporter CrcB [Aestuariivirgaceae bacterium]|nr:fluoride efflux transporter CrcB [Aestuariivirgaceae bacterium]